MEADSITEPKQHNEGLDRADLVIAILNDLDPEILCKLADVVRDLAGSPRTVILQSGEHANPALSEDASPDQTPGFSVIPWPSVGSGAGTQGQNISAAYQHAFTISKKLNARGCCIISSTAEAETPRWVSLLAKPLMESECDFVVPHYARAKFQGLLNSGIISPLTRALYGKRIQHPFGPDLAMSQRLYLKILGSGETRNLDGSAAQLLASASATAVCDGMQIHEVKLGPRDYPSPDWTNVSAILTQTLGPLFLEMERRAMCWQRIRSSTSVHSDGPDIFLPDEAVTMDVNRMVESFQLGVRDLQEIWGAVLPPASLLELRKLSRLSSQQLHMTDELWARIVYDFALAHRLRTINRDHLLRSMTPLYLAWVASFALDVMSAGGQAVNSRLEELAFAFERNKPYLLSRWRWPDRFNP